MLFRSGWWWVAPDRGGRRASGGEVWKIQEGGDSIRVLEVTEADWYVAEGCGESRNEIESKFSVLVTGEVECGNRWSVVLRQCQRL